MTRSNLLTSTISVSSMRLLGQAMVLLSGLLIANFFGATKATDDYYTALILPGALGNLVINALTNLFTPIYLKYIHDDPDAGRSILSSMMFVVSAVLLVATAISLIAVPLVTATRSVGAGDALTRALLFGFLLAINCPIVGYTRLLSVYSETHQHYSVPAVMDVLGAVIFAGVILLALPLGIYSLLIANLVSSTIEILLLGIYTNRALNLKLRPSLTLHPAVKEMLRLSFEPAIAFLALFLVPTVDRLMASSLDAGSLTAFYYGDRIVAAFEALVLSGPLLIIYYHWAKINAAQGIQAVASSVPDMISILCFVFVPLSVLGGLLSYPIISILFERGAFTAVGTSAGVFAVLFLSQMFYYLFVLTIRLSILMKATRLQAVLSITVSIFNFGLNVALISSFGLLGVALSTLITQFIISIASLILLKRYMITLQFRSISTRVLQTLLCTTIMVAGLLLVQPSFAPFLTRSHGLLLQILSLGAVTFIGGALYVLASYIFRHDDFYALLNSLVNTRYGKPLTRVMGLIERRYGQ